MPANLSNDEFTVLLLANDGQYLAPIGRWRKSILDLTAQGLMRRIDEVNYVITAEGEKACAERDREDEAALHDVLARVKTEVEAPVLDLVATEVKEENG